jgi:nitrite reductase/ring-hydroxylating ferredoxin subunit
MSRFEKLARTYLSKTIDQAGILRIGFNLEFVKVASKKDVPIGNMRIVEVNGTSILLANIDGEFYAIGNICTHRGCKLSNGALNGEIVQCPCHGSRFNVKTGEVVGGPATKPEQKYKLKTEQNQIQIST